MTSASNTATVSPRTLFAINVGAIFEFYDLLIFTSLLVFFSKHYFPAGNETAAMLFGLMTMAIGFLFRPLGGILFGRLGDKFGRKPTFLLTVLPMGLSTLAIGLCPGYETIGWWAPVIIVLARIGQSISFGGELSNVFTYMYEVSNPLKRGLMSGITQIQPAIAFVLSFLTVAALQGALGMADFAAWGWRIPFIFSAVLIAITGWLRWSITESPVFDELVARDTKSKNSLKDAFTKWSNLKNVLLMGAIIGLAYSITIHLTKVYLIYFMGAVLKYNMQELFIGLAIAQTIGIFFILGVGKLTDTVDDLKIFAVGALLLAATVLPTYQAMTNIILPNRAAVEAAHPVTLTGPKCDIALFGAQSTECGKLKETLGKFNVKYTSDIQPTAAYEVKIGEQLFAVTAIPEITAELKAAGYVTKPAPLSSEDKWKVYGYLTWLMVLFALVTAPVVPMMARIFPANVRATSLGAVDGIAMALFGGTAPSIMAAISTAQGDIFAGFYWPIATYTAAVILVMMFYKHLRIAQQ